MIYVQIAHLALSNNHSHGQINIHQHSCNHPMLLHNIFSMFFLIESKFKKTYFRVIKQNIDIHISYY
jgi:hypothetical protein